MYIFIFVPTCFYAEYLALGVELTRAVLLHLKKKNLQFRALGNSSPGVKDSEETCVNNKNIHLQAEKYTHTHTHTIYSTEKRWRVLLCVWNVKIFFFFFSCSKRRFDCSVLKTRLVKKQFFSDNVLCNGIFILNYIFFFGGIGEIIT